MKITMGRYNFNQRTWVWLNLMPKCMPQKKLIHRYLEDCEKKMVNKIFPQISTLRFFAFIKCLSKLPRSFNLPFKRWKPYSLTHKFDLYSLSIHMTPKKHRQKNHRTHDIYHRTHDIYHRIHDIYQKPMTYTMEEDISF